MPNRRFRRRAVRGLRLVRVQRGGQRHQRRRRCVRVRHKQHKTRRVSVSSTGTQGNDFSYSPSISADGRFVAFESTASNLVGNDTNNVSDVFVYDRSTHKTERVSVNSAGTQVNRGSYYPSISAHGRFVAFISMARNLVEATTPTEPTTCSCTTGPRTRPSGSASARRAHRSKEDSYAPSISAHGRFVAFTSKARNLIGHDTNGTYDVFVYDRFTRTTRRVSVSTAGEPRATKAATTGRSQLTGDSWPSTPRRRRPGRQRHQQRRGCVRVRPDPRTRRGGISVSTAGTQGNNASDNPSVSADGGFVAFAFDRVRPGRC